MRALITLVLLLGAVRGSPQAEPQCCDIIAAKLQPDQVVKSSSSVYGARKRSYFSANNREINPGCFVLPKDANDVSKIIKVLNAPEAQGVSNCLFAIRSGGHTLNAGAATIQGGVTIDLSKVNQVTIAPDKSMVSIGPGNVWQDVYRKIEPQGIAVSGGRWGSVGVGGLLSSGGLSFFQGREGPACDGILNHQVVLADGSIVEANKTSLPDLHKALKGGINNFGIITRFDMKAFPQGKIWGGTFMGVANSAKVQSNLQWLEGFARSSGSGFDANGMVMMEFFSMGGGSFLNGGLVTYAQPTANPPAFQAFSSSAGGALRVTTYTDVAVRNAIGTPAGMRGQWATFSFVNNAAFAKEAVSMISGHRMTSGSVGAFIFQPLWAAPRLKSYAAGGGNVLGLEDVKDDLIIVLLLLSNISAGTDNGLKEDAKKLLDNLKRAAQAKGVYSPYIYTNYAADFQDVIGGYGNKSREFLIATSKKYDPNQLFQKQVPGGFKLNGGAGARVAAGSAPKGSSPKGKSS